MKQGRPAKETRYKRNKDSIEVYYLGERLGNVSAPIMREVAMLSKLFGVVKVLAYLKYLNEQQVVGGFGVVNTQPTNTMSKEGVRTLENEE